jgi:hypothetical protein
VINYWDTNQDRKKGDSTGEILMETSLKPIFQSDQCKYFLCCKGECGLSLMKKSEQYGKKCGLKNGHKNCRFLLTVVKGMGIEKYKSQIKAKYSRKNKSPILAIPMKIGPNIT